MDTKKNMKTIVKQNLKKKLSCKYIVERFILESKRDPRGPLRREALGLSLLSLKVRPA